MKPLQKVFFCLALTFSLQNLACAQTQPNIENGFKPYGSYDSTHLDSINLQNGNLILHIPMPFAYPQRGGKLAPKSVLTVSSKGWSVANYNPPVGNSSQYWSHGFGPAAHVAQVGTGIGPGNTLDMSLHRYYQVESDATTVTYSTAGYYLTTWDGGTHQLTSPSNSPLDGTATPTLLDAIDNSGFHINLTNQDPTTGVSTGGVITDRHGNLYRIGSYFTVCGKPSSTGSFIAGAGSGSLKSDPFMEDLLANLSTTSSFTFGAFPLMEDTKSGTGVPDQTPPIGTTGSSTFITCQQAAKISSVTDVNGNVINTFWNASPSDTMGRLPDGISAGTTTADFSGCISPAANIPISNAIISNYQALDGSSGQMQVKVCYANVPISTSFSQANVTQYQNENSAMNAGVTSAPLIVTVILSDVPNWTGTHWTFKYDSYLNITDVGLPTGGSLHYDWTEIAIPSCGSQTQVSRAVQYRTEYDNRGNSYQTKYTWGTASGGILVNTVTDPSGNDAEHTFTVQDGTGGCSFYETKSREFQGPVTAGNLLKQVDTTYQAPMFFGGLGGNGGAGNILPLSVKTSVYPSGKVSLVTRQYDAGPGFGAPSFGNVTQEIVYDWGQGAPGAPLRETDTTYKWQSNSAYLAAHLIDLPASVVIKDGSGNRVSEADYSYDETGLQPHTGTLPTGTLVTAPNSVRGNLTTVSKWLNTANSFISSHMNWYDTGEVYQQSDPLGHTTTHIYDPAYAGAYSTQTCSPSTSAGSITHCVSGTYDYSSGLLTSFTNENATTQASGATPGDSAHTSNYTYDLMFRLTQVQAPPDPDPANGGARAYTNFNFSPPNTFPVTAQRTRSVTTTLSDSATSSYDGLGRNFQGQHTLPNGTATVDTTFDAGGRVATVSNPYFTTSDVTYGITTNQYDGLDRVTQVTRQDGSISTVAFSVIAGLHDAIPGANYTGDCTASFDEAGKQRRACTDALGRLVEVDEPNPAAPATTATGTLTINGSEQSLANGASGWGTVTISGSEVQICVSGPCPPHNLLWDAGNVSITVNGVQKSVNYSHTVNTNFSQIAAALRDAFHNDGAAPADASCTDQPCTSGIITLTARATGTSTNYSFSTSISSLNTGYAAGVSGSAFTGGLNPTSDSGSITATVNGANYSTTFGAGDTGTSIASRLATAINGSTAVTASASGNQINLISRTAGAAGNATVSASYSWNNSAFSQPSFTATASGLFGGYDAAQLDNAPYKTLYTYDTLGNLTCVEQHGDAATGTGCSSSPTNDATSPWRVRRFTYDSLSRLLSAKNPESGTISYTYDNDGSLLQKTSPAPNQTGSATQTISYCYDELHRITGRAYGSLSCPLTSPVVSYTCDSGANAKGHLTQMTDQAGTATYTYNILGRLTMETRTIAGISKSTSYTYDLGGSVKTLTYPSGRVITYTPDSAGRPVSAADSNGTNYVTSASYGPDGSLKGFLNGSTPALNSSFQYNPRLQLCRITTLTSGTLPTSCTDSQHMGNVMDRGYDFHTGSGAPGSGTDNGDVIAITNYRDTSRSQAFTYDSLNRLTAGWSSANTGNYSWGENYSIDAWGNLQISPMSGKAHGGTFALSGNAQNRPTGLAYDAAGNLSSYLSATYTYDQENRLSSTGGMSYTYDGNGERMLKFNASTGAPTKRYWSMGGNTLAEDDGTGNLVSEYIYVGDKRIARIDLPGNTVHYYLSDHLSSTSMVVSAAGAVEEESDYSAFGTEYPISGTGANRYKFTGKERDADTGLDYFGARSYNNVFARFTSSDLPFADQHTTNPQTWNLYMYALNNPLKNVDPNGRGVIDIVALYNAVQNWWDGGVKRDGGVRNFAKNNGIGVAKGTGNFAFNTAKAGVALSQSGMNPAGAVVALMTPSPKVLRPSNKTQAQAADVTEHLVLPMATAAIPFGELGSAGTTTEVTLTRLATQAADNIGPGSGAVYGTAVHGEFADLIEGLGNPNLATEVSYKGGQVVEYGTSGSVRVDVVEGPFDAPTCCYDLKTGSATLTPARAVRIQNELPGGSSVPVKEIKPQ